MKMIKKQPTPEPKEPKPEVKIQELTLKQLGKIMGITVTNL